MKEVTTDYRLMCSSISSSISIVFLLFMYLRVHISSSSSVHLLLLHVHSPSPVMLLMLRFSSYVFRALLRHSRIIFCVAVYIRCSPVVRFAFLVRGGRPHDEMP